MDDLEATLKFYQLPVILAILVEEYGVETVGTFLLKEERKVFKQEILNELNNQGDK